MPHAGQILFLAARGAATAMFLLLIATGCSRSGDVVVVLDSTTQRGAVEVVALPADPLRTSPAHAASLDGAPRDSVEHLRVLEDSATRLDTRFRALRDSVNTEVTALDTADRRTRAYARRYADIRRRTLVAESIRSARDSVRTRAGSLRTKLEASAATRRSSVSPAIPDAPVADAAGRTAQRHRAGGPTVTLSLQPGPWWIGVANGGTAPTRYDSLTVRAGATDTIRPGRSRRR